MDLDLVTWECTHRNFEARRGFRALQKIANVVHLLVPIKHFYTEEDGVAGVCRWEQQWESS
jgi:hypothetical protein